MIKSNDSLLEIDFFSIPKILSVSIWYRNSLLGTKKNFAPILIPNFESAFFSSDEKSFKKFYEESIALNNLKFKDFIKLKKNNFKEVSFKQPKTGINVDKRHQFSPLQIVDILNKVGFKVIDIHPINYHPVPPIKYSKEKNFRLFSNFIYKFKDGNKLPYIPFSSSFMVTARKIK